MGTKSDFFSAIDALSNEEIVQVGRMNFWLEDYNDSIYNESVDCNFPLYGILGDEVMSIETYKELCMRFARVMGFTESTIKKYFGA